jgi:hypothetical protein
MWRRNGRFVSVISLQETGLSTGLTEKIVSGIHSVAAHFCRLSSGEEAAANFSKFRNQGVGISSRQGRGIDLGLQQDRCCQVCTALQTTLICSSGKLEQFLHTAAETTLPD